ncbi:MULTISPECIES: nuclear transport factor 2 family protein [Streptomyces]|uniref:nuclear transport factor 2 family protein n=1 Tax=Streptomyces TaxID=1883 RepID=UPI0007C50C53|nr:MULTISPECIES: nuclear transport factor 2 family protein [Streptomyces]
MTTPQDLKEVFKHGLDLLSEGRIEEWIDGFTEDGILEFPYPAWGVPSRMQGREALLAQMTMFRDQLKVVFSEPEFSTVNEDDLVIAAYTGECTLLATGGQYCQTYLSVVRFEQNRIALYRDFWDPWLLMQAAGGELAWKQILPTLASKPTAGKQASRTPQDTRTSHRRATR